MQNSLFTATEKERIDMPMLNKVIVKMMYEMIGGLAILSFVDRAREIVDILILGASIVILNTLLMIGWSIIKMWIKLYQKRLLEKHENEEDVEVKKIVKGTIKEIDNHLNETDKKVKKLTETTVKPPKKDGDK